MDKERNQLLKNITELLQEETDTELMQVIYLLLYGESLGRK